MNLAWLRRRAALGLWTEIVARAAAPACGIVLAYIAAALFGLGSPWLWVAVLAISASLLAYRITRLRPPAKRHIDRRIEQASGLRHRPIAMLEDAPANDSEFAAILWQIHRRRAAASLQTARAGRPLLDAAIFDPFALRGLLLLLLLAGAVIAGPSGLPRLAASFAFPAWPYPGPSVNAWITEPAFTGAPPLVLAPGDHPVVLAGSRLTVVLDGQARPPAFLGPVPVPFTGDSGEGFRADAVLRQSARLRIGPWWHPLAKWDLTVLPPEAPSLQMRQPLVYQHQLLISWHAQDRYGLASLTATLAPAGHNPAIPEVLNLPLANPAAKDSGGTAKPDIADSPYAGLQVTVLLEGRNLANVTGSAGPMTVRLPKPDLHDPTAAALFALRQRLSLQPDATRQTGAALQQLAQAPPSRIGAGADLQMAVLARQLAGDEIAAEPAQKLMNLLLREIEEGPDYAPARALAAADQALTQALRQSISTGKPLDDARLQSLLAALHQALARHLQALGPSASVPGEKTVDPGDLDRMAEQIAQDEANGQTAKAAAELNRLQQILSALQSARPMTAEQAKRAHAADQAAQDLSRLTRGESTLLDQTNQGNGLPANQAKLQGQLAVTEQNLAKAGIALPGLNDAGAAMGAAHDALTQQDTGAAAIAEGGAIQALQKAAAALQASAQGLQFGAGTETGPGDIDYGEGLDGGTDEQSIPGILPSGDNPAGAIQQQIIKNDDDPALPSAVHQYYHRLLNQDSQ